jgi:putative transposase
VKGNQAEYSVRRMCELLGVSPSGYYGWLQRPVSQRELEDRELTERILEAHRRSRGTYGAPRIHAELRADGVRVGRKRVARLMRAAGIEGVHRRRKHHTTRRDRNQAPAPDLVNRDFTAGGPDRLWVADITYIPTWSGFLYLAVVIDAWSRRVVGWGMRSDLTTQLVLDALDMAIWQRNPNGVVHHSDQGTQGGFNWWSQHCPVDRSVGARRGLRRVCAIGGSCGAGC